MPEKETEDQSTDSIKRIQRYKEERRKQLAAQAASRLSGNASSSEEDDQGDRRSYTEFKRRRRRERGSKENNKGSSRHNLNSSGGELYQSRSRGSPDTRISPDLQTSPSLRGSQDLLKGSPEVPERSKGYSRLKGSPSRLKSRSRDRSCSNYARRRESLEPEPQVPQGAVGVGAAELDRNKDSPEHIYQVIPEPSESRPRFLGPKQNQTQKSQDLSTDSASNISPAYSKDSLDRSGSRDSLGDKDLLEREGLVSPDIIRNVSNQITPTPRRRRKNQDESILAVSSKFPSVRPTLDLTLSKTVLDLNPKPHQDFTAKSNLELDLKPSHEASSKQSNIDLTNPRLNIINNNPESPGSVLSPSSNLSASKPPIFPAPDRSSNGFKFQLKKSGDSPPGFMRSESSRSDTEPAPFIKEFNGLVRRRSGQFNPNEVAPPKPLPRPHSVYRMEGQINHRGSEIDSVNPVSEKERRKSDFLSHYEELTCRAAMAIKTVDLFVREPSTVGTPLPSPGTYLPSPLSSSSCLPSPLSPGVESVEFNEEEVLKTCQDFLVDYNKAKQQGSPTSIRPGYSPTHPSSAPGDTSSRPTPIPAPRFSISHSRSQSSPGRSLSQPNPTRPISQLSQEDELLLEAAQGKQFWESGDIEKTFRARSSSFSMPDRSSSFLEAQHNSETSSAKLRPILKKSTEDLSYTVHAVHTVHSAPSNPNSTISILKNRDDIFGKGKRRSAGEDGKGEHVRIRSPSPNSRGEHVRIRSPSPDSSDEPRTSHRSRNSSFGDDRSDSEIPSILKRRASADDFMLDAEYNQASPEKASILKRKASFGSTYSTYSGSHSPDPGTEGTRSILKKSSRNSSRTCSRSASFEDLDVEGTKSILKSRNSSRTCSRSGSQEELDLDLDEEEEEWMEPKPKSILKKKQWSTDDELDDRSDRPKSILKSRRSEESISPSLKSRRSEESISPVGEPLGAQENSRSGSARRYSRHSSLQSDTEEQSGRTSPVVQFPSLSSCIPEHTSSIRPILKHRDDTLHGILKHREKSSSPVLEPVTDQVPGDWTGSGFDATKFTTNYCRTDPGPGDEHVLEPQRGGHDEGRAGVFNRFRSCSPPASESSRLFPSHSCSPRRGSPPLRRMEGLEGTPLRILERRDRTPPLGDEDEVLCIEEHLSDNGEGVERSRFDERKLSLAERVKIFDSLSAAGPNLSADSAGQIISADAAWQNMSADASGQNIGRPPRIGGATATGSVVRRRRKQNSRFQTQPITVDEVEKARKGFFSDSSSRISPLGGPRTSPLFAMLRPVSLEELAGDVVVPQPRRYLPIPRSTLPESSSSSGKSSTSIRFSPSKPSFSSNPGSSNTGEPGRRSRLVTCVSEGSLLTRNSLFRPVISPPPRDRFQPSPPRGQPSPAFSSENVNSRLQNLDPSPPPLYTRSASSPVDPSTRRGFSPSSVRRSSPVFQRQNSSPHVRLNQIQPSLQRQSSSPPRLFQVSPPSTTTFRQSPLYHEEPSSLSHSLFSRSSAFRPVPTAEKSSSELTPVSGPIPVRSPRRLSRDESWKDGEDEDLQSILKVREEPVSLSSSRTTEPRIPRRSILKNDSVEEYVSLNRRSVDPPGRSVLKKDSSYDGARAVSSPNLNRSNSNSSDDVGLSFTDVVIDPVPRTGRKSAPETPVKRGTGSRTPVIPRSSIRISADGDLAGKLAKLSTQADNMKLKMSFEDKTDPEHRDTTQRSSSPCQPSTNHNSSITSSSSPCQPSTNHNSSTTSSSSPYQPSTNHNSSTTSISPTLLEPITSIPLENPAPPLIQLPLPVHLPPPAPLPPTPSVKPHNSSNRSSRKVDLPKPEDFYAIYQQQKRRNSLSPAPISSTPSPKPALSSGTPSPKGSERRSLRQRSASPQCRKGVEFWEEKEAELKRASSQERDKMSARTDVQIQGGGIMERLAQLQKHGDEDWRKRVDKPNPLEISRCIPPSNNQNQTSPVLLRKSSGSAAAARPVSLMDRMSKLNEAQGNWQKKVEVKDTKKFTVEGKMEREKLVKSEMSGDSRLRTPEPVSTPVNKVKTVERERRTPTMTIFKGSNTPVRARPVSLFVHSENVNNKGTGSGLNRSSSLRKVSGEHSPVVPSPTPPSPEIQFQGIDEEEEIDFDEERINNYKPTLLSRKTVQPPRRTRGSRNPVKNLLARQDLVTREEDLKYQENKENMNKVDRSSKHSHLAAEALAGLASTEDFTSVQLRKDKLMINQNMQPYKGKMLIQVKGRRFCQCRLVEPVAASINSGDCYILVTGKEVFNWQGKFSNVIERSRSAEVALTIIQKKDLGCKGGSRVQTIEEEKLVHCSREYRRFCSVLTGSEDGFEARGAGPSEEDEDYEQSIVDASCVYEVNMLTDELVPIEEHWGLPPRYSLLDPAKVLVFDFGSEVYAYSGKNASFEARKVGARLAQELWSSGWNYEGCNLNPVYGVHRDMMVNSRPDWTILGRINSNMETILFREKFTDWPDKTRVIGKSANGKEKEDVDVNTPPSWAWADLAGWTGDMISNLERLDPDLQLEGSHLGRGREFYDTEERRQYIVETLGVKCWYVEENDSRPLPESFSGQFHSQDTYVVRWKYKVALTGRNLKGGASKYSAVGRDRCAYFFWQGEDSKISLQGASALQTVELDSEKGPQLRVQEGIEHAAFLSLFSGNMMIYKGRRGERNFKEWRLFLVRGQERNETYLKEIECSWKNLRSQGVFVLCRRGKLYLWIGRNSAPHQVEMGEEVCKRLALHLPGELGLGDSATLSTLQDGSESSEFWSALGGDRNLTNQLFSSDIPLVVTPRLFHMTSVLGSFEVVENLPEQMKLGLPNPLLFSQDTLYSAEQPGLYMLDTGRRIYLWQGWMEPDSDIPSEGTASGNNTGSGLVRWHAERRAAMSSILDYKKEIERMEGRKEVDLLLVWAGHEPQEFINYFPQWEINLDVKLYNTEWVEKGSLEDVYQKLSRTEYSWMELQVRPFPPGVDPARIEHYLSSNTFKDKFKMSKEEFQALPRWKQIELKKDVGLF